jgi:hypothetical protein
VKNLLLFLLFVSTSAHSQINPFRVHSFIQGKRSDGGQVIQQRSIVTKSLVPQKSDNENDTINFFSLGFGGSAIFEFSNFVENNLDWDIEVWETTWNYGICNTYPERAEVYAGYELDDLRLLGTTCLNFNTQFDLEVANLAICKYLMIKDVSPKNQFVNFPDADAYDIDGVEARYGYVNPLPIELLLFSANFIGDKVEINIVTLSESSILGFSVEYSENFVDWNKAVFVQAIGNTNFKTTYSTHFVYLGNRDIYVRLRVLNTDLVIEEEQILFLNKKESQKTYIKYDILGRACENCETITFKHNN